MKEIFKSISDRIAYQVAAIRWVDFDLGQLDQETPPVSWPCALVGFNSGEYLPLGQDGTLGEVIIEIVVAFQLRERTHSRAATSYRDEAISHLDTVDAVRIALTGLKADSFGPLTYLSFANDRRADLRVWRLRFAGQHAPMAPDSEFEPLPDDIEVDLCLDPEIQ